MNNPRYYTGIGEDSSPNTLDLLARRVAEYLALDGFVLRTSTNAGIEANLYTGAIKTNEENVRIYTSESLSYLPLSVQEDFEAEYQAEVQKQDFFERTKKEDYLLSRALLLGSENVKSSFVLCWTPECKLTYKTRNTILLAKELGIKVFNLADQGVRVRLANYVLSHT